jgi:hypothetical protein
VDDTNIEFLIGGVGDLYPWVVTECKRIEKMREMLWWREELKDISIRFYYLVRVFTVKLAEEYHKRGIIRELDDIWFLKINDLFDFIDDKKDENELRKIIEQNRKYYNSFRNFKRHLAKQFVALPALFTDLPCWPSHGFASVAPLWWQLLHSSLNWWQFEHVAGCCLPVAEWNFVNVSGCGMSSLWQLLQNADFVPPSPWQTRT